MPYRAIADYYDAEYEGADDLVRDVPFFMSQLQRRRGGYRILDLATGSGRAALPLAQAGHRVVGIDYDADMLTLAEQKRDLTGLSDNCLTFCKADLSKLSWPRHLRIIDDGEHFDIATIFFNTFLAFTSEQARANVLSGVCQQLKPDGQLWLDFYNPDPAILAETHHTNLDPHWFYVPSLDRAVHRTTEVRQLDTPQLQQITFHYRWLDPDSGPKHETVRFELTYMYPRELTALLHQHGFTVERMWGDYNGNPVTRDSPRIICLSRRKGVRP